MEKAQSQHQVLQIEFGSVERNRRCRRAMVKGEVVPTLRAFQLMARSEWRLPDVALVLPDRRRMVFEFGSFCARGRTRRIPRGMQLIA